MKTPSKNRISELPAEIAIDILSQLKAKEAARTSILSRGWRYMWTPIYNLDFDGSDVLNDLEIRFRAHSGTKSKCVKEERLVYVNSVNQALGRHEALTIDQFAVVFSLDDSSRSDIETWVNFALRKQVQRLKLNLRDGKFPQSNPCRFPSSLEIVSSCSSLRALHLDMVNIDGETLQLFMRNCLNLERVFVSGSRSLLCLNVQGCPSLKWLELYMCHKIGRLEVSAPNLVSFKYVGRKLPLMPLKNAPNLLEISVWSDYGNYLNTQLSELSSYVSRLEKLTLDACVIEKHRKYVGFPVFPKLKHLSLIVSNALFKSIIDYASLIKACPSLYRFSFQSWAFYTNSCSGTELPNASVNDVIRVVEFNDFRGFPVEVEVAKYLIENSVRLEKITFEVVKRWEYNGPLISATKCARELGERLRPGVELIIV